MKEKIQKEIRLFYLVKSEIEFGTVREVNLLRLTKVQVILLFNTRKCPRGLWDTLDRR